jgi:hypothetical protein
MVATHISVENKHRPHRSMGHVKVPIELFLARERNSIFRTSDNRANTVTRACRLQLIHMSWAGLEFKPQETKRAARWLCYWIINRHTFHCVSVGNYQAVSNQRFPSTHNSARIHNVDCWSMPGRTQPISAHITSWLETSQLQYYSAAHCMIRLDPFLCWILFNPSGDIQLIVFKRH